MNVLSHKIVLTVCCMIGLVLSGPTEVMGMSDAETDKANLIEVIKESPTDMGRIRDACSNVEVSGSIVVHLLDEALKPGTPDDLRIGLRTAAVKIIMRDSESLDGDEVIRRDIAEKMIALMQEAASVAESERIAFWLRRLFPVTLLSESAEEVLSVAERCRSRRVILLYSSLSQASTDTVFSLTASATNDLVLQGLRCRFGDPESEGRIIDRIERWPQLASARFRLQVVPRPPFELDIGDAILESGSERIQRYVALGTRSDDWFWKKM